MATTTWQIVAVVMTEAVALLLLLGGIAVVIAQVPKKLRETGEHESYSKWAELYRQITMQRAGESAVKRETIRADDSGSKPHGSSNSLSAQSAQNVTTLTVEARRAASHW